MNVDPKKLLDRLGCSMGAGYACPLHPDADACLSFGKGPRVVFTCASPLCRFSGDAVSLVSLAKRIPVSEAILMFLDGGELADCVVDRFGQEDADAYLDAVKSQDLLKAYLDKCVHALRENPELSGIRAGMSRASLRLLHPNVGLFVPGDDVPRCLRELEKPKYGKSRLILYPYTMNGEITRIEALDPSDTAFRHVAVVTHPDAGVFGELPEPPERVVVVDKPEVAAKLYSCYAQTSAKVPPVIACRGFPLPGSFAGVTNLDVLSFRDAPISTEFVLGAMSAADIKPGRAPVMRIADYRCTVMSTSGSTIDDPRGVGMMHDPQHFVAARFSDMVRDGRCKEVLDMLSSSQAPAMARNLVKAAAETQLSIRGGFRGDARSAEKLVELLGSAELSGPCEMSLANGKAMHSGPDGIFAIRSGGSRDPICNVGLAVDSRIITSDGREVFACTVSARGGFPAVKVEFLWSDLTADRMRASVQKAYAEMGLSPYVAFYSSNGFAWRDVVAKLAENCPVERRDREPPLGLGDVSGGGIKIGLIKGGGENGERE